MGIKDEDYYDQCLCIEKIKYVNIDEAFDHFIKYKHYILCGKAIYLYFN